MQRLDFHYLRTSVSWVVCSIVGKTFQYVHRHRHITESARFCSICPPLSIGTWLQPDSSTFCKHAQLIYNLWSLLLVLLYPSTPFFLPKSQDFPCFTHAYIIYPSRLISNCTPLPTISSFPNACWVSLHHGLEYCSLYYPTLCCCCCFLAQY